MNEFLWQTYHRLISNVDTTHHRFLYDQLSLEHRLTGIIGPRGVGKTTMLLQYIKENFYAAGEAFYFSADNIYFNEHSIVSLVDELYREKNITLFFIDEIHKYAGWDQELKNIYDSFPDIKLFFSGSSSIDLIHGSYDLSRRARLLYLPGLSFREYLNIKTANHFSPISFDDLLQQHIQLTANFSSISTITKYFEEYKQFGYYPFVFENRDTLYETLSQVIEKTIYEDIANFYNIKTGSLTYFKKIISFLASIPPGEINTNNIAKNLGVDNKTVDHYLVILQKTGLIKMLFPIAKGHKILTKPAKIYLDNSTLQHAANTLLSSDVNTGTESELAFLQSTMGAGLTVLYPHLGDFQIKEIIFEIGGKNKKTGQLKSIEEKNKFLVKDNILVGNKNEIPLYLFGFLY